MNFNKYKPFTSKLNFRKSSFSSENIDSNDEVLLLKSPKVLSDIAIGSNLTIGVNDIIHNDNNKGLSSLKFDKKNKLSLTSEDKDSTKSKKTKSKLNKNKHRHDNDDVKKFVNNEEDIFSNNLLGRSTLKSRKPVLKNKKNKLKNQNLNNATIVGKSNQQELQNLEKSLFIDQPLSIKDLSLHIQIPEAEIITYLFLNKGISATINEILDFKMCDDIAQNYGFNLLKFDTSNTNLVSNDCLNKQNLSSFSIERSPVITILGHVDHGKTTLLDAILKTNLVDKEKGGITQAIAGYEIIHNYNSDKSHLIFLDTPGHESFKSMRLRGARITDIVLLVIAIDDGLKPQTIESINYIKEMSLSCIVVITKSDKSSNNLEKIKKDLANHNLLCEDLGGNTPSIQVSAVNGYNIDILLSKICLLAKSKDLCANPQELASGTVIDAFLDQKQGPLATIIIQNGTLNVGDILTSENLFGRVKNIINSYNVKIKSSGPSSIVKVLCFSSLPKAGSSFYSFTKEKDAKKYITNYSSLTDIDISLKSLNARISIDNKILRKQLNLIIKANTQGSLEAILNLFSNMPQSKVQIHIISASFGNVTNSDINLSITSNSPILAFNVSLLPQVDNLVKKHQISFKVFYIIYDLFQHVQDLMLNLVEPEYTNILTGNAIVKTIFKTNIGHVAGCVVRNGKINLKSYIHVSRKEVNIYKGHICSLKYMKNDVEEVISPSECGLMSDFQDWQESDLIEAYDMIIKEKVL